MHFLTFSIFAALIVAADQFTKYLTVANIALYEDVPFIPGLLDLTYITEIEAPAGSVIEIPLGNGLMLAEVIW